MVFSSFISQKIQDKKAVSFSGTVTVIGISSIALALAVMIISFSVLFGFKDAIFQKLLSINPPVRITRFSTSQSFQDKPIKIEKKTLEQYKHLPNIASIQASIQKAGILKAPKDILGVVVKGIGKDFSSERFNKNMLAGKNLDVSASNYSKEIIISQSIANRLHLKIGDSPILYFLDSPERPRKLKIKGIYQTYLEEFDQHLILADIRLLQELNQWKDSVGSYELYLHNFQKIEETEAMLNKTISVENKTEIITKKYEGLFDWLKMLDRNVSILLPLIAFVACFNIVSILLVLIMERTQMIGLLKALGATNWQIRKIFIQQGIDMLGKGLFFGNLLGILFSLIQKYTAFIPLNPENYYMKSVPITLDFLTILLLNFVTLLLVGFILIIPTFAITKISPIKAINFRK